MFRNTLPSPLADNDVGTAVPTELIPLSYLALDLPVPPQGWADFLVGGRSRLCLMIWVVIVSAAKTPAGC